MKIEFPYKPKTLADIAPGRFFVAFEEGKLGLFLRLAPTGRQTHDAAAFTVAPRPDGKLPALTSTSFLQNEPVAEISDAVVRPDLSSLHRAESLAPLGAIGVHSAKTTLWVMSDHHARNEVNLADGVYGEPHQYITFMYSTSWEVGFLQDGKFKSLFSFAYGSGVK